MTKTKLFNILVNQAFYPKTWPACYRKAFVLLAPITIPLWLFYMATVLFLAMLSLCFLVPICWLFKIYNGEPSS